jgi:glutamate synthase domain-containing protein 2
VFQIGTAKFGVRDTDGKLSDDKLRTMAEHENVRMFELKLAQGAKPGKGGILPGEKVTAEIAAIRGLNVGQDGISPNRHAEVDDWDDLLTLIVHIREVTGKPVGIKMVVGTEPAVQDLFDTIVRRGADTAPDFITIDGGEGGTGAAPMPLIDLVGMSVREALPLVTNVRDAAGLKDRVRLVASGKLVNPGDIAWALAAGADFVTSARGFRFSLGCVQARKCHKNTCPTGITTHDKRFQKGLVVEDKYVRVARYAKDIIKEVETIAHSVGVAEPRLMRRRHVRIMQDSGRTVPMNEIYPSVQTVAE